MRDPNRSKEQVKTDIESTLLIVREDIYDVLKTYENKPREEALNGLNNFLLSLSNDVWSSNRYKNNTITDNINKVLNDMDSYGVEFKENEQ